MGHRYSKKEVDAILARAIEHDNQHGELSHDDLVAAAGEVGISREALEKAAAEVMTQQSEREELAVIRREQWQGFRGHLIPYIMVNGLLVTINVLTTHFPWALFPAVGWGIGLVSHLMSVVHPDPQRLQKKLQRRREREQRRALKEQLRNNARLLEQDVGQGISAVLQAVARRIEGPTATRANAQDRVRVASPSPGSSLGDTPESAPGARDRDMTTRGSR
jgi:hypothetical protein